MWATALKAAVLVMISANGASSQEATHTANYNMVGCRAFIVRAQSEAFRQGKCVGIVGAIVDIDPKVCAPNGSTLGQTIQMIVQYIDGRPERLHENFTMLATESLRRAWPCKN